LIAGLKLIGGRIGLHEILRFTILLKQIGIVELIENHIN